MKIEADVLVEDYSAELGISLADLIALASVWVSPEVYEVLHEVDGVWYLGRRRANLGRRVDGKPVEAVGQVIDGVRLDNNTYANFAFKRALGIPRSSFVGFHVCHIWRGTAYDVASYTNIANLVGIPAELSSLTDHHPHIAACLKFRAWQLYHWKPARELAPVKPERYPLTWREPLAATDAALKAAARAVRGLVPESEALPVHALRHSSTEVVANPSRNQLVHPSGDMTNAALTVAFYLSRFEHEGLRIGNQGETITQVATRLGVKRSTLKNYRDFFDSYTGSRRVGWKAPLPPQLADVFPAFMRLDEPTLRRRVLELIGASVHEQAPG